MCFGLPGLWVSVCYFPEFLVDYYVSGFLFWILIGLGLLICELLRHRFWALQVSCVGWFMLLVFCVSFGFLIVWCCVF